MWECTMCGPALHVADAFDARVDVPVGVPEDVDVRLEREHLLAEVARALHLAEEARPAVEPWHWQEVRVADLWHACKPPQVRRASGKKCEELARSARS